MLDSVMIDTVFVGVYDTSIAVSNKGDNLTQVIIIQDKKTSKETGVFEEYPILGNLIVPLIITLSGIYLGYLFNKSKFNREVELLKTQSKKNKAETEKIKKSFQPVVVGTIQSVNDKLVETKIKALKELTQHKSEFTNIEQQYYEGEPVFDYHEFLDSVFIRYSYKQFEELKRYKDEFSYFFAEKTFERFTRLFNAMRSLYETRKSFESVDDGNLNHGSDNEVEKIIKLYDEVFESLRGELHLDNTFIDDFIKSNQIDNNKDKEL